MNDRDLLALEAATIFALTDSGRIQARRPPDNGSGPRLHLTICASGSALLLGDGVGWEAAQAIEHLVADEPPLIEPHDKPVHLDEYLRILAREAPVDGYDIGPVWTFPTPLAYQHAAPLIHSDTSIASELLLRLETEGMPEPLVTAGFVNTGELWPPWCIALEGEEIASIAFTVGMLPESAEVGVYTFPAFRGRGFAAGATAGWASHPALRGRALFYGTSWSNLSSQRVAQRLGLRFLGTSLTIA